MRDSLPDSIHSIRRGSIISTRNNITAHIIGDLKNGSNKNYRKRSRDNNKRN